MLDPKLPKRDPYLAYCIDDAAACLLDWLRAGRVPKYVKDAQHNESLKASLENARRKKKQ
jgi:hypothetical protein